MAILKVPNRKGKYFDPNTKEDLISYITRSSKTPSGFINSVGVDTNAPAKSMLDVAEQYGKTKGVQARHFILSFSPREVSSPKTANEIAMDLIAYLGEEYQCIYAVHEDTDQLHIHIIMNSISYLDGHRYRGSKAEFYQLTNTIKQLLRPYHIRTLQYVSNKKQR